MSETSDKSNQPALIQLQSLPVNTAQSVESDVLEPLTFSQTEAVWEFAPKGFLHPSSTLVVGFENNANLNPAFPFVNIGVHSLVRRAVLRTTAGRVICNCEDWSHLQAIKSMLINNSTNKNKEQYLSGRAVDYEVIVDRTSSTKSTNGYGLSNGLEYNLKSTDALEGLSAQPHLKHSAGSTLQIKLHDLFPYMKSGNQLPLYLLPNERIQVQLFWTDTKKRIAVPSSADAQFQQELKLDKAKCKIISDHVFYPAEVMEKIRNEYQGGGRTFEYVDYRLSKQSLSTTKASEYSTRNIGGAGMVVNKVLWGFQNPNDTTKSLLGEYNNQGGLMLASGDANALGSNLYMNGEYLFPIDVINEARHFHNLKEACGMVPFVSRECYCGSGAGGLNSVAGGEFEGRKVDEDLGGLFFAQGFSLSGLNKRVDQKGIDIKSSLTMVGIDGETIPTYTQRAWLEIRRYLIIKDGHLECYFV